MEAASDFLKLYIGKDVKFDVIKKNEIKFDDEIVLSNSKLNKVNLINKVKDLYSKGVHIRQICREVNISRNTVGKYIDLEDLENTYSIAHIKKHDLYHNDLIKLLKLGKIYAEIANELKIKGLNYSYSSIAKYCNE